MMCQSLYFQRGEQGERAVDALFTFVSLDKDEKPQLIPALKVE